MQALSSAIGATQNFRVCTFKTKLALRLFPNFRRELFQHHNSRAVRGDKMYIHICSLSVYCVAVFPNVGQISHGWGERLFAVRKDEINK